MPCNLCDYGGHYGHSYGECDRWEAEEVAAKKQREETHKLHKAKEAAIKKKQNENRRRCKAEFSRLKKQQQRVSKLLLDKFGYRSGK